MTDRVVVDIDNHVATVTLNRPGKKNAVDFAMFDAIRAAANQLRDDASVRAVVLHGEGTDFCAGVDISVFAGEGIGATAGERMKPQTDYGANYYQDAAICWRELPVPVIAALNGSVFGAGLQIAMGADLRYAAADVRLSIMEIRWGIIPDMGITATMPGFLAEDRVRELAYTGRIVDAGEAARIGLVTDVVDDPLASATAVAHEIAARNPDAVRATKQMISAAWRGDAASLLGLEASLQLEVMAGDNQKEAAAANIEQRPPVFRDTKS
jgi:enoyl-CoA hydratase/carnithine racemase